MYLTNMSECGRPFSSRLDRCVHISPLSYKNLLRRRAVEHSTSWRATAAAQTVGAMGDEGREFVPELKAGLWHADLYARQVAGKTLQKIAPEALPGVR